MSNFSDMLSKAKAMQDKMKEAQEKIKNIEFEIIISDVGEENKNLDLPFTGGWFTYLSYELIAQIEPVLAPQLHKSNLPIAFAVRIPSAIYIDHKTGKTFKEMEEEYGDDVGYRLRSCKHRYVIFVGNKKFKREAVKSLRYAVLPYPKSDANKHNALG